jgi:hypothetical protein
VVSRLSLEDLALAKDSFTPEAMQGDLAYEIKHEVRICLMHKLKFVFGLSTGRFHPELRMVSLLSSEWSHVRALNYSRPVLRMVSSLGSYGLIPGLRRVSYVSSGWFTNELWIAQNGFTRWFYS